MVSIIGHSLRLVVLDIILGVIVCFVVVLEIGRAFFAGQHKSSPILIWFEQHLGYIEREIALLIAETAPIMARCFLDHRCGFFFLRFDFLLLCHIYLDYANISIFSISSSASQSLWR
jgi:hypothetical protein